MKNVLRKIVLFGLLLVPFVANAGTISQTIHFANDPDSPQVTPRLLYEAYLNASSHQKITGLPVKIFSDDQKMKPVAAVGDRMDAFCFSEDNCGLQLKILELQEGKDAQAPHSIVLSWWNFGWLQAVDKSDLQGPKGSAESIVILTFKSTLSGAQIELTQVNVPDYKVTIPNPDGSVETGPLSQIVNTHWNTLYWDAYRRYLKTI